MQRKLSSAGYGVHAHRKFDPFQRRNRPQTRRKEKLRVIQAGLRGKQRGHGTGHTEKQTIERGDRSFTKDDLGNQHDAHHAKVLAFNLLGPNSTYFVLVSGIRIQ